MIVNRYLSDSAKKYPDKEASVTGRRRLDQRQVKTHFLWHPEDIMAPQIIEFVEELPVSTSGKIKRKG